MSYVYDNSGMLNRTLKSLEECKKKTGTEMITNLVKIHGWENQAVRCINNDGYEDSFELGVTYLCIEHNSDIVNDIVDLDGNIVCGDNLKVMDMMGNVVIVSRYKFELVKKEV
jgi:hypothetical protein